MNLVHYSSVQQVIFNTMQRIAYLRRSLFLLTAAFVCAPLLLVVVPEINTPVLVTGVLLQAVLGIAWFDNMAELANAILLVRRLEEAGRRMI